MGEVEYYSDIGNRRVRRAFRLEAPSNSPARDALALAGNAATVLHWLSDLTGCRRPCAARAA